MVFISSRRGNLEGCSLDRYLKEIGAYPPLSREEEARLAARIREGCQDSLDRLVRANLRFVVYIARKFRNQGVALGDLINEGNLGLIRAAHGFDETKGVKFISYAVWWVRHSILQALAEQGHAVKLPAKRAGALRRIGRCSSTLLQERGREPTVDEIADALELSREEVQRGLAISLSLDAPLTPGGRDRLVDYLPDKLSPGADDETCRRALAASIEEALGTLDEREVRILRLYFGLEEGKDPMTLEEIGALLRITRARVSQIKERALLRLRAASCARRLQSFMEH